MLCGAQVLESSCLAPLHTKSMMLGDISSVWHDAVGLLIAHLYWAETMAWSNLGLVRSLTVMLVRRGPLMCTAVPVDTIPPCAARHVLDSPAVGSTEATDIAVWKVRRLLEAAVAVASASCDGSFCCHSTDVIDGIGAFSLHSDSLIPCRT